MIIDDDTNYLKTKIVPQKLYCASKDYYVVANWKELHNFAFVSIDKAATNVTIVDKWLCIVTTKELELTVVTIITRILCK